MTLPVTTQNELFEKDPIPKKKKGSNCCLIACFKKCFGKKHKRGPTAYEMEMEMQKSRKIYVAAREAFTETETS